MKRFTSINGHTFEIVAPLALVGGQAKSFDIATRRNGSGTQYLIKWLADAEVDGRARNEALLRHTALQQFPQVIAPRDLIVGSSGEIGVVTPYVQDAQPLGILASQPRTAQEHLAIALQLAHLVANLDEISCCHNDLGMTNLMLQGIRLILLDLDNFTGPGLPPARMAGQEDYCAPERIGNRAPPDWSSEAFSLALIIHELTLGCHAFDNDITADEARTRPWRFDPLGEARPLPTGQNVWLAHPALIEAFRATINPDPKGRAPAKVWWELVRDLLVQDRLVACQQCGNPLHLHSRRDACPHCSVKFERGVISTQGDWIPVNAELTIGRDHCGGDPYVSREHLRLRRRGPELMVKGLPGTNVSWALLDNGWQQLTDQWTALPGNTQLRLNEVALQVV